MDTSYEQRIWAEAYMAAIRQPNGGPFAAEAEADKALSAFRRRFSEVKPEPLKPSLKVTELRPVTGGPYNSNATGWKGLNYPMRQVRDAQMIICSKAELDPVNRELIDVALSYLCSTGQVQD